MATTIYIHLAEVYCNSPLRHQILVVPSMIQYQLQTIALLLPIVVGLFSANKISTLLLLPKEKITCAISLIQMKVTLSFTIDLGTPTIMGGGNYAYRHIVIQTV